MYHVSKMTEEGQYMFSCQFDETEDMTQMRTVVNERTGELWIVLRKPAEYFYKTPHHGKSKKFNTKKGYWVMWSDGYQDYVTRLGDR